MPDTETPPAPVETPAPPAPAPAPQETPAAAPQTDAVLDEIEKLKTPEEIENFLAKMTEKPSVPANEPASKTPETPAPPAPAPAPQETPAAAPQTETPPASPAKKQRIRITTVGERDARVLDLKKNNPDLSFEECLARAKAEMEQDNPKPTTPPPDARNADKIKSELAAKAKELAEAAKDFDGDRIAAIQTDIATLTAEFTQFSIKETATREQSEAAAAKQEEDRYNAAYNDSLAQAGKLFDFVANRDSAQAKRMVELEAQLKDRDDPLFYSPDKPRIIALMVAAEFGIAPKSATTPAPAPPPKPATPTPAPAPAVRPVPPVAPSAAGTSRQPSAPVLEQKIAGIKNTQDYEDLVAEIMG